MNQISNKKSYKFCSKEFYNYINKTLPSNYENITPIEPLIVNNYCTGYCKKIEEFLHDTYFIYQNNINGSLSQFAYIDLLNPALPKHKFKLFNILNYVSLPRVLPSIIKYNRHNNIFKKVLIWVGDNYFDVAILKPILRNDDNVAILLPALWYITIFTTREFYFSGCFREDGGLEDMPKYVDSLYGNKKLCLSFIQRKVSKRCVSPAKRKEIMILNKLITICLKTFTTKNMTKLILFYI